MGFQVFCLTKTLTTLFAPEKVGLLIPFNSEVPLNYVTFLTWKVFHQCEFSCVYLAIVASQRRDHRIHNGKVSRDRALSLHEQSTCQLMKISQNMSRRDQILPWIWLGDERHTWHWVGSNPSWTFISWRTLFACCLNPWRTTIYIHIVFHERSYIVVC